MPTKNDDISKLAIGVQYNENPRYSFPGERSMVGFFFTMETTHSDLSYRFGSDAIIFLDLF